MTTYRITFTPSEPYFFGNEKTFRFPDMSIAGQFDNPYFIRSEALPAQTTMFGAIRYLMLNDRDPAFESYPENYEQRIGKDSFRITDTKPQSFGIISGISPVFLQYRSTAAAPKSNAPLPEEGIYVKTPLDHRFGEALYTPFRRALLTENGESPKREYAEDYDVKKGLSGSYMNIGSGKTVEAYDIFRTVTRVGISKKQNDDAFFKKEFCMLSDGWSFGVYLTLNTDSGETPQLDPVVFLGQNKSAFLIECVPEENRLAEAVRELLQPNTVYCLGDTYASSSIYHKFTFAVTLTRDHRTYETVSDKNNPHRRICKGSTLHKLLRAGSVFWLDPTQFSEEETAESFRHPNAATVGMNQIIIKK